MNNCKRRVETSWEKISIRFSVAPKICANHKGNFSMFLGSSDELAGGDILLIFALKLFNEVVYQPIVKVLTTQMSITCSGLHLKDATINGQQ